MVRRPSRSNGMTLAGFQLREVDPFSPRHCPFRSCERNCAFESSSEKKRKEEKEIRASFNSTREQIPKAPRLRDHSRKRFFSRFLSSRSCSSSSSARQQIAVHWEWKFGTINSNGAYVLGDLLLGSPSPPPRPPRPAWPLRRLWNPFFSRLNSMVTLVVLFIGCVPSLRRRATTATAHTTAAHAARPLSGATLLPPFPRSFIFVHHNSVKFGVA